MDDRIFAWVVTLGSTLCMFIPCLLLGGAFLAGVYLIFKRLPIFTRVDQALAQPTEEYLAEVEGRLLPWSAEGLSDLSAYLAYVRHAQIGFLHARGLVKSMRRVEEKKGWLAFDLQLRRSRPLSMHLEGGMVLKSSLHTWNFRFLGVTSRDTPVEVDGLRLGMLRIRSNGVELLDTMGRTVGLYRRPPVVIRYSTWRYRRASDPTPRFAPVEMNGRYVAQVNYNPVVQIVLSTIPGDVPAPAPLVQDPAPDLSEDEEMWLIALVGREIMYRIITK